MATTTLSIDKDIRDLASKRASADKLSVSAVARMLLRDYAQGKISIGATVPSPETYHTEYIEVDTETQETMDSIRDLWNQKKSV